MNTQVQQVIGKLEQLPPDRLAEVEDFIDFLCQRENANTLRRDYAQASERAFSKAWNNEKDASYDGV